MFKYRFCYMIDARAELGIDNQTGEFCEIYLQVTPEFEKEVPPEIQGEMHKLYGIDIARNLLDINPDYVHPISTEEYDANAGDDNDEGESLEVELHRED